MLILNRKVKDRMTGFVGYTVSRHQYISGEDRYGVQGPITPDGKIPPVEFIDESRLIPLTK